MPFPRDPTEPFADQLEWLNNRYNPGYFLGGTLRPELRIATLGWHGKRVAGTLAFLAGLCSLGFLAAHSAVARTLPDPWSLAVALLSLLAGIRLWMAARLQGAPEEGTRLGEGRRLLRVVGLMALGALVATALSIAVLAALAVMSAISRGAVGLIAALCVTVALVAVRRQGKAPAAS